MIGLEYICKFYDCEYKEVAEKLNISRQAINSWLRGKKRIPINRLVQLSKMFDNIPQQYFQKEITEIDKLEIQKIRAKNNMGEHLYVYSDPITGEVIGEEIVDDPNHIEHIEYLQEQINKNNCLKRAKDYFDSKSFIDKDNNNELHTSINLFNEFIDIVESGIDVSIIHNVLNGMKMYNENIQENNEIAKGVAKVISNYVDNEGRKVRELIELGFYTNDEIALEDKKIK